MMYPYYLSDGSADLWIRCSNLVEDQPCYMGIYVPAPENQNDPQTISRHITNFLESHGWEDLGLEDHYCPDHASVKV